MININILNVLVDYEAVHAIIKSFLLGIIRSRSISTMNGITWDYIFETESLSISLWNDYDFSYLTDYV